MIPNDLNIEEFAQTLAGQAAEAFPPELPENIKQFVAQVVYEFINIAGNALNGEEQPYTAEQTVLICQLVGEWMFHKGIDNSKNQIPEEYWKPILQQIAFAIFESAKNGVMQGQNQDYIINLAEEAVTTTYRGLIEQLAQENRLGGKSVEEVLNQSNLHDYVEQNYNEASPEEQASREGKDMKLMTMALLFKTMPPPEVGKLVKFLDENERRQLLTYINMPDLDRLVDPVLYNQYLEKFHNFIPDVQVKKRRQAMYSKITNVVTQINPNKFEKMISYERKNVKNFLLRVYNGKMYEEEIFSPELTTTVIDYVTQKVNRK